MLFAYLNLPSFPDYLIDGCLKNIDKIDNDPELYEKINKFRGRPNLATWVTKEADQWILDNITTPYFSPVEPEMNLNLLNVTFYVRHLMKPELNGQHGPHKDEGRVWALNYYFSLGGDSVKTLWYDENENEIQSICIQPHRWCILRVDYTHAVRGLRIGHLRTFISMNLNRDENYLLNKVGNLIDKSSILI